MQRIKKWALCLLSDCLPTKARSSANIFLEKKGVATWLLLNVSLSDGTSRNGDSGKNCQASTRVFAFLFGRVWNKNTKGEVCLFWCLVWCGGSRSNQKNLTVERTLYPPVGLHLVPHVLSHGPPVASTDFLFSPRGEAASVGNSIQTQGWMKNKEALWGPLTSLLRFRRIQIITNGANLMGRRGDDSAVTPPVAVAFLVVKAWTALIHVSVITTDGSGNWVDWSTEAEAVYLRKRFDTHGESEQV